jgi:hypothetical protein
MGLKLGALSGARVALLPIAMAIATGAAPCALTACAAGVAPSAGPTAVPTAGSAVSSRAAPQAEPTPASSPAAEPPESIAAIHGGAGPWVVAGYRMGRFALERLGLPRYSFALEVTHRSPARVQYTCVADGAAAATGASLGKLNLRLEPTDEESAATTYRNTKTGESITLRPTRAFVERFKDVPREGLARAGRDVMALADEAIFEVVARPEAMSGD